MSLSQELKPSSKWSLKNQVIMLAHGTEDARGYDQWKQAGRQVRKGSKAFYILGPSMYKDKETGEMKHSGSFHNIPVFGIEQTDPIYCPRCSPANYKPDQLCGRHS